MVPIRTFTDPPLVSPSVSESHWDCDQLENSHIQGRSPDSAISPEQLSASDSSQESAKAAEVSDGVKRTGFSLASLARLPMQTAAASLNLFSLLLLISLVSAIPLLQFASLGYLLHAAARLAEGQPWRTALPGLQLAGRIGLFLLLSAALYLPVLLLIDLAYSAELLEPDSQKALLWHGSAVLAWLAWCGHIAWSAARGGRWWHLVWPAPIRFLRQGWRASFWADAWERGYQLLQRMQLVRLWWLGVRASVAALLFLAIPVSLMILGQRAEDLGIAPLLGIMGAIGMVAVMFTLPFLQVEFARTGRLIAFLQFGCNRRRFLVSPIAHTFALLSLCVMAIPLYLLRIEATPSEILWLPSVFFAALMLPAKLLIGWAIGRGRRRLMAGKARSPWWVRFPCRLLGLAGVLLYVGSLYVAQLIAGQGALVMYFQHAFLVPNPLFVV